ncbi:MAG: phosphoadenylyl-sulfate reductase [Candidatus Eremiobacteraeota bacterium]|nr:phosphoadenylyl-sulfate reductase [Candidatus Eremiobacteraeota bacterium]
MEISEIFEVNREFEDTEPQTILEWGITKFKDTISLACSFGAEDVVLLDMLSKIPARFQAFVLDTGRLPQETYNVMEQCRKKYGIEFKVFFPERDKIESLIERKGPNSFYSSIENRKECCYIRKVEPLSRALDGLQAWITGLRREQSVTRNGVPKVEIDPAHGNILKLNPLADWTNEQVWNYIRAHQVPYNELHDKGYPSIGCAPCTRAVKLGEDLRAGRWWWEAPELKECGIHPELKTAKV